MLVKMSNIGKHVIRALIVVCVLYSLFGLISFTISVKAGRYDDSTVHMPEISMPFSHYASDETEIAFVNFLNRRPPAYLFNNIEEVRDYYDKENRHLLEQAVEQYPVVISDKKQLGGVPVYEVIPSGGVLPKNQNRVLINLHGGGFLWGAGAGAKVESVPIASVMGVKVVSVDYRMAPEHRFPAATMDVVRVYSELLKQHQSEQVETWTAIPPF